MSLLLLLLAADGGTAIADRLESHVFFEHGSVRLNPHALPLIADVAATLKDNPKVEHVIVEGHAAANEKDVDAVSQKRAEAVRAELVRLGVDASRLAAKGVGSSKPMADGNTSIGKAKNRRVGFVALPQK